jgi:hypothetical protein
MRRRPLAGLMAKWTRLGMMLAVLASLTNASPVLFDLQGVQFTDGATGTGYFLFNPNVSQFLDWNIVTSSTNVAGFVYTPLTSLASTNSAGCMVDFIDTVDRSQSLCLIPDSSLVAGASPDLLPTSFESFDSGYRFVSAGTLQDPQCSLCSVPEPSTFNFVGFGALAILALTICRSVVRSS